MSSTGDEKSSVADNIVTLLMGDLNGRKGFRICDLDKDIQDDIRQEWIGYINNQLAGLRADLKSAREASELLKRAGEAYAKQLSAANEKIERLRPCRNS